MRKGGGIMDDLNRIVNLMKEMRKTRKLYPSIRLFTDGQVNGLLAAARIVKGEYSAHTRNRWIREQIKAMA